MSRQIQIRRGTAAEHTTFTGAIGEITMDTTNKTIRVHDGATAGGTVLAKQSEIPDLTNADYVVASQLPTAENNYTWYRKYKSGWVEQGGQVTNADSQSVTIPITMADTNYQVIVTQGETGKNANYTMVYGDRTTTGFNIYISYNNISCPSIWQISGVAAA